MPNTVPAVRERAWEESPFVTADSEWARHVLKKRPPSNPSGQFPTEKSQSESQETGP